MKEKYIGELLIDNCYETFDGLAVYIDKLHDNYAVCYISYRDRLSDWKWTLKSISWLRENIRTILEVY